MTCAKTVVICKIECVDGRSFYGTNNCDNAQPVCPRTLGEGYEKCKSICHQEGHAEEIALEQAQLAGANLRGAKAYISGIGHYCKNCQLKLFAAGVVSLGLLK